MADAAQGAAIAHACAACHGPEGRSQGAIPALAARPAADLLTALRELQTGARQGTVMHRLLKGLSDAELQAVAAYFATRVSGLASEGVPQVR